MGWNINYTGGLFLTLTYMLQLSIIERMVTFMQRLLSVVFNSRALINCVPYVAVYPISILIK